MERVSFTQFMASIITDLEAEERWATARVYAAALGAVTTFVNDGELFFSALTSRWLKRFETYLRDKQRQWNTVSTYLRMIRATYNRAVMEGCALYLPYLFKDVFTAIKCEHKQALPGKMMHQLIYAPARQPLTASQEESREWFRLMFELQGMPFVDLAHLRHSDLDVEKRLLSCRRQKTGTNLEISLTASMMKSIERLRNTDIEASPYLFPILTGGTEGLENYREYQRQLALLNRNVSSIAGIQGVNVPVSSYTARHTWATMAKHCDIPEGLISEALGHTSVRTTRIYLKSFDNSVLEKANAKVVGAVKRAVTL